MDRDTVYSYVAFWRWEYTRRNKEYIKDYAEISSLENRLKSTGSTHDLLDEYHKNLTSFINTYHLKPKDPSKGLIGNQAIDTDDILCQTSNNPYEFIMPREKYRLYPFNSIFLDYSLSGIAIQMPEFEFNEAFDESMDADQIYKEMLDICNSQRDGYSYTTDTTDDLIEFVDKIKPVMHTFVQINLESDITLIQKELTFIYYFYLYINTPSLKKTDRKQELLSLTENAYFELVNHLITNSGDKTRYEYESRVAGLWMYDYKQSMNCSDIEAHRELEIKFERFKSDNPRSNKSSSSEDIPRSNNSSSSEDIPRKFRKWLTKTEKSIDQRKILALN